MNYEKQYHLLIEKADKRGWTKKIANNQGIYVEQHHITPKCIGGHPTDPDNIVIFLPEEHFVAHQLLIKMFPYDYKLKKAIEAFQMKSSNQIRNNKMYSWIRKQCANANSIRMKGNKYNLGKKRSEETKQKISDALSGKPKSDSHRKKIGDSKIGNNYNLGKKRSEEAKQKMRDAWSEERKQKHIERQRNLSPDYIKKRTNKMKLTVDSKTKEEKKSIRNNIKNGIKNEKAIKCPYCGLEGRACNMKRWHFDNCKKQRKQL